MSNYEKVICFAALMISSMSCMAKDYCPNDDIGTMRIKEPFIVGNTTLDVVVRNKNNFTVNVVLYYAPTVDVAGVQQLCAGCQQKMHFNLGIPKSSDPDDYVILCE